MSVEQASVSLKPIKGKTSPFKKQAGVLSNQMMLLDYFATIFLTMEAPLRSTMCAMTGCPTGRA